VQWQASSAPLPVNAMDGETRNLPPISHARRVGEQRANRPAEDAAPRLQSMTGVQRPTGYFSPNGNAYS
jgi:hypothetical protein